MGTQDLDFSDTEKDLRIHIESKLSFEGHVNRAVTKANGTQVIFRKIYNYMDAASRICGTNLVTTHNQILRYHWRCAAKNQKDYITT